MTEPIDVLDALAVLDDKRDTYAKCARYYLGDQDLSFASEVYRDTFGKLLRTMRYNRCASVVDAISDRLQVKGWQDEAAQGDDTDSKAAGDAWNAANGDFLQGLVHVEALRAGDAYLIVWPDPEDEAKPVWTLNRADTCYVMTDDDTHQPFMAVKLWRVTTGARAGFWRLTIYTKDSITRWVSSKKTATQPTKPGQWIAYEDDGEPMARNPYGVVPVIHFPNNPQFQGECGISELMDVMPLQDGLNYSVWQLMVAGEFSAWPQKWATGVEPLIDPLTGQEMETFKGGIDRWLKVASDTAAFGSIVGADLGPFLEVQDSWDRKICRVSRVPAHGMGLAGTSDNISGESRKVLESSFVSKLRDRQVAFGDGWKRAMQLALTISGQSESAMRIAPVWESPEPRSELEGLQNAQLKQNVQVPMQQIWKELGYTPDQIKEFVALAKQKADEQAERFATQFARGGADGFEDGEDAA